MAKTFKLEIVTPERMVLSRDATSLVVPGVDGYLGILADHAPLMAELTIGEIRIIDPDGHEHHIATSGGFMQVADNVVRILADTAEREEEIDIARAREALRRAEERLREQHADIDNARAAGAVQRAMNRLRVARGQ
jgi:F-type H+-transporting ATPase subunit epsilon